jgi:NAD(P)-dependent dehydrogenase (short-subunit alcohol dehydrogenase family)
MQERNFSGKVILITGAAGGLGSALCRRYAQAGARIAAMDLHQGKLDSLVATLPEGTLAIAGNIADPAVCQQAVAQTLSHFGALDGLINNAGISHRSLLSDTDPSVIRRVMEVNFFGAMQLTHAALPHLIASRGMVAAISSVAGYAPLLGRQANTRCTDSLTPCAPRWKTWACRSPSSAPPSSQPALVRRRWVAAAHPPHRRALPPAVSQTLQTLHK